MPAALPNCVAISKGGGRPLGQLISEISACLETVGDAAASTQQPSDGTIIASRIRGVLPMIFAHVNPQHGAAWDHGTIDCMQLLVLAQCTAHCSCSCTFLPNN